MSFEEAAFNNRQYHLPSTKGSQLRLYPELRSPFRKNLRTGGFLMRPGLSSASIMELAIGKGSGSKSTGCNRSSLPPSNRAL